MSVSPSPDLLNINKGDEKKDRAESRGSGMQDGDSLQKKQPKGFKTQNAMRAQLVKKLGSDAKTNQEEMGSTPEDLNELQEHEKNKFLQDSTEVDIWQTMIDQQRNKLEKRALEQEQKLEEMIENAEHMPAESMAASSGTYLATSELKEKIKRLRANPYR